MEKKQSRDERSILVTALWGVYLSVANGEKEKNYYYGKFLRGEKGATSFGFIKRKHFPPFSLFALSLSLCGCVCDPPRTTKLIGDDDDDNWKVRVGDNRLHPHSMEPWSEDEEAEEESFSKNLSFFAPSFTLIIFFQETFLPPTVVGKGLINHLKNLALQKKPLFFLLDSGRKGKNFALMMTPLVIKLAKTFDKRHFLFLLAFDERYSSSSIFDIFKRDKIPIFHPSTD